MNERDFAVRWIGEAPNAADHAASVSPLRYVHGAAPPVITIHGDADATVPFSHALRLHDVLDAAGVPNRLVRVRGGDHGDFAAPELRDAYRTVFDFLAPVLARDRSRVQRRCQTPPSSCATGGRAAYRHPLHASDPNTPLDAVSAVGNPTRGES